MISRYTLAVPVFGIFLVAMGGIPEDESDDVEERDESSDDSSDDDTVRIEVIITDSSDS